MSRTRAKTVTVLFLVCAALTGLLGYQLQVSSSSATSGVDTSPFEDVPTVARLDPELLTALRRAATDAADDGVELDITSGWRSAAHQQRLLDEAVARYGSRHEAALWVATPTTSLHVSGDAADIGPSSAVAWLLEHGAAYGLCRVYDNEPWHFELRPDAADDGCPPAYADPAHDPRMQG